MGIEFCPVLEERAALGRSQGQAGSAAGVYDLRGEEEAMIEADVRARLERLAGLDEGTTPGPWAATKTGDDPNGLVLVRGPEPSFPAAHCYGKSHSEANAALIADAPDLPELARWALGGLRLLELVEWSKTMFWGYDGRCSCCPVCFGIKPGFFDDWSQEPEELEGVPRGHRDDCELAKLLRGPWAGDDMSKEES